MMDENELLDISIDLDHPKQLELITSSVKNIKLKFESSVTREDFDDAVKNKLLDYLDFLVDRVAFLSTFVFEKRDQIRDKHLLLNKHAPHLGEKLFYEEYFQLSKPYDKVKINLDKLYKNIARKKYNKRNYS